MYTLRERMIYRTGATTRDLYVDCWDAYDGMLVWTTLLGTGVGQNLVTDEGYVYVGANWFVAKLDAATGALLDTLTAYEFGGFYTEYSSIALGGDAIYISGHTLLDLGGPNAGYFDLFVALFNKDLEGPVWVQQYGDTTHELGGFMSLSREQNVLYLAGTSYADPVWFREEHGVIAVYDLDGNFRRTVTLTGGRVSAVATGADGAGYINTSSQLIKVLPDGSVAWVQQSGYGGVSVYGGVVFIASYSEKLLRYDAADGTLLE